MDRKLGLPSSKVSTIFSLTTIFVTHYIINFTKPLLVGEVPGGTPFGVRGICFVSKISVTKINNQTFKIILSFKIILNPLFLYDRFGGN